MELAEVEGFDELEEELDDDDDDESIVTLRLRFGCFGKVADSVWAGESGVESSGKSTCAMYLGGYVVSWKWTRRTCFIMRFLVTHEKLHSWHWRGGASSQELRRCSFKLHLFL